MFGFSSSVLAVGVTALSLARAHTVITYPGWRGDNLQTNGTVPAQNPGSRGIDFLANGSLAYPWGMQWIYPCKIPPPAQQQQQQHYLRGRKSC